MKYYEFLEMKNGNNYIYKVECKFTNKTLWRNMNYHETIHFCKGRENEVLIWLD